MPDETTARFPGIVKAAVVVTFFNTWVLFEETVIDRYGLGEHLPFYRVAEVCTYDIVALPLIIWLTLRAFRKAEQRRQTSTSTLNPP